VKAVKIALLQMNSGLDPQANADAIVAAVAEAAGQGAAMLYTPEMSGLVDGDRKRAVTAIKAEHEDIVLAAVCEAARAHGLWVAIGSLALTGEAGDGRSVNRAFVIDGQGGIVARYDKIHLFDVDLATGESWRESSAYVPGTQAVVVETPVGTLGLSICYDLRFPALYAALTEHGARVLAIPAAFTVPTGEAHWHVMQRARAIEGGCFVVSAAQTGAHEDGRHTFGHSLVIDPWGKVLLDMGTAPGLGFCEIDLAQVAAVRSRVPALAHRRPIEMAGA
jgi:deaminated glutathione amidase